MQSCQDIKLECHNLYCFSTLTGRMGSNSAKSSKPLYLEVKQEMSTPQNDGNNTALQGKLCVHTQLQQV